MLHVRSPLLCIHWVTPWRLASSQASHDLAAMYWLDVHGFWSCCQASRIAEGGPFPKISRVLVLSYRVDPIAAPQLKELESAAATLGVKLLVYDIHTGDDIPAAFDAGAREGVEGVLTTAESIFAAEGKRVVQLALEHKLPGMYPYRLMVDAGGLMAFNSYTSSFQARTAIYVDKILKGANPSDLPVEQPTKFELFINMRTARTLGLSIPLSLIVRADELIE